MPRGDFLLVFGWSMNSFSRVAVAVTLRSMQAGTPLACTARAKQ
jgi:hypothetical protein